MTGLDVQQYEICKRKSQENGISMTISGEFFVLCNEHTKLIYGKFRSVYDVLMF